MTFNRMTGLFYGSTQETRRPQVMGRHGVVASGHYLASQAGMRILQSGGNAVDAGVAAGMCLNVLLPYLTNLGGVAPIILYSAREKKVTTISGLGRWSRTASIEKVKERGNGDILPGALRCVTPAALDSWVTALERYGTKTFAEVAMPALELAEDGFAADRSLSIALESLHAARREWKSTWAVFAPKGKTPGYADVIKQPDLARTFKTLIRAEQTSLAKNREGRLRAVRDAFYKGDIAKKMAAFVQSEGGFLTRDDLAEFAVKEEAPVSINYKGFDVYACGPWCQGMAVPQTLKLLEGVALQRMGHNSPDYIHHLIEAVKLVYADRDRHVGDPEFVKVPVQSLLSDAYAAQRRTLIDAKRASPGMPKAGEVEGFVGKSGRVARPTKGAGEPKGDTSYVCVIDSKGNGFSATPSDFIGDVPIVPGLGIVVSGRGNQSWLDPKHASSLRPWKRPRLTPNPGLVLKDGELFMTFGTPGGDQQPQAMVQAFLNMVEFGMAPQQAVEAPRVGSWSFPNSFWPHEYLPARMNAEGRIAEATVRELTSRGHQVEMWREYEPRCGHVCAVVRDRERGVLHGAADSRFSSYAIA